MSSLAHDSSRLIGAYSRNRKPRDDAGEFPITTLLQPANVLRLREELPDKALIIPASCHAAMRATTRSLATGIAIVDAVEIARDADLREWLLVGGEPGWISVIFAEAGQQGMRALLSVSAERPLACYIPGISQRPGTVKEWYERDLNTRRSAGLLRHLTPRIREASPIVAAQIAAMLASHRPVLCLKQFAVIGGANERSVHRGLRRIGIGPWPRLAAVSRALRSWEDIREQEMALKDVAAVHGFGSVGSLRRQWQAATGTELKRVDVPEISDELLRRLAQRLFVHG